MATVVRIKRRRDEDPVEALILSCKKRRSDGETSENEPLANDDNLTSVLKFAGTVESKDFGISRPVREAIRKEKIERAYKQHQTNILEQVRQQHRKHSQQSRYKVTAKQRAGHLDNLDCNNDPVSSEQRSNEDSTSKDGDANSNCSKCDSVKDRCQCSSDGVCANGKFVAGKLKGDSSIKEDCLQVQSSSETTGDNQRTGQFVETKVNSKKNEENVKDKNGCNTQEVGVETVSESGAAANTDEKVFCLLDVEADVESRLSDMMNEDLSSQITCNNIPMVREPVTDRSGDEQFVYDLYYTNTGNLDFRSLENMLTIQAFGGLEYEDDRREEEDYYEDDEDSNDEGHWRNDYPDEDPDFYENEGVGFDYPDDMAEHAAFESEDTNQLAEWMSWRCNIEDENELSSEDEVQDYGSETQRSYEAYYRHVAKEIGYSNDPDDDSDFSD